jgi:hypothetical protein
MNINKSMEKSYKKGLTTDEYSFITLKALFPQGKKIIINVLKF